VGELDFERVFGENGKTFFPHLIFFSLEMIIISSRL